MAISLIATVSTDAGSGNVSITHGLTIASGDVLIATINANGASNTVTDNNGSTPFTSDSFGDNPDSARFYVFHRVAGSSEPSSYSFTLGSSNRWSIVIRQYRGVDASVWDVAPAAGNRATGILQATADAPAITIVTAGACGLVLMGDDGFPTTTTFTSVGNGYANAKSESGQEYQATADKLGLSTGSTGGTSITSSANVSYVIYQCALKPASGQTGSVNQLSETDTLQAFSRTKQKEIGQQSETNTLQAFSRQKTITLGLLSETTTVQAFARAKQKDLGQLESTESLFNFSIPIVYTLGLLTETSELQNFSRSKTAELQILTEPQLLFEFARLKEKEIGLLSTNETVQPFTTNKSISLGLLEEINTLFSISLPGEIVYELGILEETSTVLSIARIKQIEIGLLSESGQLFTLDKQKITEIGLLSEASLLFALSGGLVPQAHYVYIIAAESRVFVVPAVEPDPERIYTIPAESRVYEVEHD